MIGVVHQRLVGSGGAGGDPLVMLPEKRVTGSLRHWPSLKSGRSDERLYLGLDVHHWESEDEVAVVGW